ncbi:hypothetical protein BLNAU_21640 [Blattamonas nauphoetae]|uniref:Uncharacterized protein n=1 Tax=Blattamonas nauphoetae TaxID=2049346 RepID=A0ABQ9WVD0_9EUKA|nr:hypothetical protein BLNAU_21640 [Blattamonas nauphoetae]
MSVQSRSIVLSNTGQCPIQLTRQKKSICAYPKLDLRLYLTVMIESSSQMQEESPHQLIPTHSILPTNSDPDQRLISEREPFLNCNPYSQISFKNKSTVLCSLVALVKAEYPFDETLLDKAARFLKNLVPSWFEKEQAEKLVTDLVLSSAGSPSGFVDSILTLLSSSHSTVVAAALSFLHEITIRSSIEIRSRLVESDLISSVLATVQPDTLPITGNDEILDNLIWIIVECLNLADSSHLWRLGITDAIDKVNHREMIFQKVVIPSSQFMTFLISNRNVLSRDLLDSFMSQLATLIHKVPFHIPTLEFVLKSPIVMAFSRCLSFVEDDFRLFYTLNCINKSLENWKKEVGEVAQSGKRMMQALISEGFEDTLEQMLKHDKDGYYATYDFFETLPQADHEQGMDAYHDNFAFVKNNPSLFPFCPSTSSLFVFSCPCHPHATLPVIHPPNVNGSDSTQSVASRPKQTKPIGRLVPPANPALEWVTLPTNKTDETLPFALSASPFFLLWPYFDSGTMFQWMDVCAPVTRCGGNNAQSSPAGPPD